MQAKHLNRRFVLLLPLALAACGGGDDDDLVFAPLRYNDLPPIQVKVATIAVEQRFMPSGVPPDVSNLDPAPPSEALKAMANDRLQAFGTANKAVFAVLDASMTRDEDAITGSLAVSLTIVDDNGVQMGYAEAHVHSRRTGQAHGIRPVLYDMTKTMMNDMNIEFEYQIRHNLKAWLTDAAAPGTPVEQAPLDGSGPPQPPAPAGAPPNYQPPAYQPSSGQPSYGQPPSGQPPSGQPSFGQPPSGQSLPGQPPGYQQPNYQPPGYQQPAYQQPNYQPPGYQPPGYQQPAYQSPGYQPPTNLQPPAPVDGAGAPPPTSPAYPPPTYLQPR
jgi:hypothetical protein